MKKILTLGFLILSNQMLAMEEGLNKYTQEQKLTILQQQFKKSMDECVLKFQFNQEEDTHSQNLSKIMHRKEKKFKAVWKELTEIEKKFLPKIQEYKNKINNDKTQVHK